MNNLNIRFCRLLSCRAVPGGYLDPGVAVAATTLCCGWLHCCWRDVRQGTSLGLWTSLSYFAT